MKRIRGSAQDCSPNVGPHLWKLLGSISNPTKEVLDLRREINPNPEALSLVPRIDSSNSCLAMRRKTTGSDISA